MAHEVTKIADLINPEVIGAFLHQKMLDNLVLAPFAEIDRTLQGRPGDTLTLPQWNFIGLAEDLAEGQELQSVKLTAEDRKATVKKVAKSVTLTDEAVLNAYVRPVDETVRQLAMAIAGKIDNDLFAAMRALTPSDVEMTDSYEWVIDAQVAFGEEFDEETYLFISPKRRASILKSKDFIHIQQGVSVIKGHLGEIYGMNIVVSNKVSDNEAFVLKRGALTLLMKRDYMVEEVREGMKRQTNITADQHYVAFVKDAKRAIFINKVAAGK
ncbi:major head protein [Enterococcus phage vB_Efs10_KEN05]